MRDKADIIETFIELSLLLGKSRVLWRYDPVILNDTLGISYHAEQFGIMCERLHLYTEGVTISFVDNYAKLRTDKIRDISHEEMERTAEVLTGIAEKYGMIVRACCEKTDLSAYGIERAACIDKNLIERLCGYPLKVKRDTNQREGCGCCESRDIGVYNTCKNGCVYCYANFSSASVEKNVLKHKKDGGFLI